MEARELRCGNFVFSQETQEIQKIKGIDEEHVFLDCITFDYVGYDEIQPIPLTEEWLLRFGFVKKDKHFIIESWRGNALSILLVGDKYAIVSHSGSFGLAHSAHINYVHQIQNLYWSISGKELVLDT